jgi:hypothetical protein
LLRARRERPSRNRTAEKRDEVAARDHSITSSAATNRVCGIVRPSAFAVLRLMTTSILVDCWTGLPHSPPGGSVVGSQPEGDQLRVAAHLAGPSRLLSGVVAGDLYAGHPLVRWRVIALVVLANFGAYP